MTDEEIEELIEALNHGRSTGRRTYYNAAADALVALKARAEAAEKDAAALRDALAFYRDGWVSSPNRRYGGLDWHPKESLLDDCGNVAKNALEAKP